MTLKEEIYHACMEELKNRKSVFQKMLLDLSEGAQNDSKSSAGDKHETARAMMQIEQEKIGKQLKEVEEMSAFLNKINVTQQNEQVMLGSLVKTNEGYFYVAAAIGKLKVADQKEVYVLSPKSPLALKLIGLKVKSKLEMNAKQFIVESIL